MTIHKPETLDFRNAWKCCQAIQARYYGVWDTLELKDVGPMTTDFKADVLEILEHYGMA